MVDWSLKILIARTFTWRMTYKHNVSVICKMVAPSNISYSSLEFCKTFLKPPFHDIFLLIITLCYKILLLKKNMICCMIQSKPSKPCTIMLTWQVNACALLFGGEEHPGDCICCHLFTHSILSTNSVTYSNFLQPSHLYL